MPEVLPPAPPRSLSPSTPADYKFLGSAAVGAALSNPPTPGVRRGGRIGSPAFTGPLSRSPVEGSCRAGAGGFQESQGRPRGVPKARGGSQSAALLLCLLASLGARGESRGNRPPLGDLRGELRRRTHASRSRAPPFRCSAGSLEAPSGSETAHFRF